MKELTCAFTLTLVSLVAATPHGYGVKGGAFAKAEASAVAGGLGGLPLSIPSGAGFSGSFSKSASSSSASSSASSSSSSFSYSGYDSSGLTGIGTKSDGGCSTGGCQNGGAGKAGSQGLSSFGADGFQANSGANAAATAGASAIAGYSGSKDGSPTCTTGECSNQPSANLNSDAHLSATAKSISKSNTAAGSGTAENGLNSNCASEKCGLAGQDGSTAVDYEPISQFETPSNHGASTNCASGKCISSSLPGVPTTSHVPSSDCASGKCASGAQPGYSSTNYGPNSDCISGKCDSASPPGAATAQYGLGGNCASGQCGSSLSPKLPSNDYGHLGPTSPSTGCKSGQCEPNTVTGPASSNYGPYDIPVFLSETSTPKTQDSKHILSDYDKTSTDCSFGNCGQSTSTNFKPSYYDSSSTINQNANAYSSGQASGYNKPAPHLTTPKQGSSDYPKNTFNTGHIQGTYKPTDGKTCIGDNCDYNPSNGLVTSIDSGAKCTSTNCAPNVYNNENPKTPNYSAAPEYQAPTGPGSFPGSPNCVSGNCATYPSTQSTIGFSSVSEGQYKPTYPHNQASQQPPLGPSSTSGFPSIPPSIAPFPTVSQNPSHSGVPSFNAPTGSDSTNCKTPNCASYPSVNIDASAGANTHPVVTGTLDQKLPTYTGGFGGPAGLLKPNDYSSVSIGINKPSYPLGQSDFHVPTGGSGFPSHSLDFGTSPTISKNPSGTHPGIPSYNTPTGSESTNCKTPNCSSYPSAGDDALAGTASQSGGPSLVGSYKPSSSGQKLPVYTGGFGGAAGILQPSDYSLSTQVPASQLYSKPTVTSGAYNPASCTSGNCKAQSPLPQLHASASNGSDSIAFAAASANAVAYAGGFGGPPGLLKPYDDGKLTSGDLIKHPSNSQFGVHHGDFSGDIHSSYGSDKNKNDAGSQAGTGGNAVAGAQASAIAGAVSNLHGNGGHLRHDINYHKGPAGCGGGCSSNAAGSYSDGAQFGYNGALGKVGHHDGRGDSLGGSGSSATAKSLAGAFSGANAYGASGSFASSSATAHASAGAGTKGGYYGR